MLSQWVERFDHLARWFVWIGGTLLIGAAFLVTADVLVRKIFGLSLAGSDELSGYAFGVSTMLAMAYALLHRTNIRVDAFYHHFPAGLRVVADMVGLALLIAFVGAIAWLGFNLLADSITHQSRSITPLRTPLTIPQAAWFLGAAFCILTGVLLLAAALAAAWRRDWPGVQRLIGIKSVDEQIEDESA